MGWSGNAAKHLAMHRTVSYMKELFHLKFCLIDNMMVVEKFYTREIKTYVHIKTFT